MKIVNGSILLRRVTVNYPSTHEQYTPFVHAVNFEEIWTIITNYQHTSSNAEPRSGLFYIVGQTHLIQAKQDPDDLTQFQPLSECV